MDKEFCLNCVFWLVNPMSAEKDMEYRRGFCRRYPPIVYGIKIQNPTTRGDMWCGEWEGSEEKE